MVMGTETTEPDDVKLDVKQRAAFDEFKKRVSDLIKPDYYFHQDWQLVKFCQARNFDVKKAELMFRNACELRTQKKLDLITENYTPKEVITEYLTGGMCGFDKEGRPIRVERFGKLDTRGIVYSCRKEDLEMFKLWEQEKAVKSMQEQSRKLGKRVHQTTVLLDLENISSKQLWRPGLQLYLHLIQLLEDNYPEMVKHIIVINAPKIFPIFYKVCRPLISDSMRKKLHVYGANYQLVLKMIIDDDNLPSFLGGKLKGPNDDVHCTHLIRPGGLVPESLYLRDLIDISNFEPANIGAGGRLLLKVPIDQPNCVIRWEFKTEGKDIAFGVSLTTGEKKSSKEIIPLKRVQSHLVPEYGSITCDHIGTYVVTFDNSYSWTKSKKLFYNLEALIEDDETMNDVNEITGQ